MKKLNSFFIFLILGYHAIGQNVGVGTNSPQAKLDINGGIRAGGTNNFLLYDSLSGKFSWSNSYIWATGPQYLMKHSASSEGLYYSNAQLAYLNDLGIAVFSTNWSNGNGYFYNHLGIGTTAPQFPLSFAAFLGDKISLYGDAGPHYGFGVQPYLLQIHTDDAPSDIAFGYGSSASFTETMRIKGNGNTGIGTATPSAKLHVVDGAVVFAATGDVPATPGDPPVTGAGRRMVWYSDKAAFRAGYTGGIDWDKNNIGNYSVAMGSSTRAVGIASVALGNGTRTDGNYSAALGQFTRATGDYSFAIGNSTDCGGVGSFAMGYFSGTHNSYAAAFGVFTTANGSGSVAMGSSTTAGGDYSVAMGVQTNASGTSSLAMGQSTNAGGGYSMALGLSTTASGLCSTAFGLNTTAKAIASFSAGLFNDDTDSPNPTTQAPTDRIFQIGNGNNSTKSNALTVLQNGNIGIGTVTPAQKLQVAGNICATGSIGACSDIRYKKDLSSINNSLASVLSLNGIYYYWKKDEFPHMQFNDKRQIGFSAQEIEKLFPELVMTDANGYKAVDYGRLTPVLVEAIKEQEDRINKQQQEIDELKKLVEKLIRQ